MPVTARLSFLLMALLLAGCTTVSAAPGTPVGPTSTPTRAVPIGPSPSLYTVLFHGDGSGQSAALVVEAGSEYVVDWQALGTGKPCFMSLVLQRQGGGFYGRIANESDSGAMASPATVFLHDLSTGLYYVEAIADCPWVVVLARAY